MKRVIWCSAALVALTAVSPLSAGECGEYSKMFFELVERAQGFQETEGFREYGWSRVAAAPANGWLDDMGIVRDYQPESEVEDFWRSYGIAIQHVHGVADAFRTDGGLDSYWNEVNEDILRAQEKYQKCK